MKSLRFMGNSRVEVAEVPEPALEAGQVLVRVRVSALCGSEMGAYRGPAATGGNGGHEFAGEVTDANGHAGLQVGDRVAVHVVVGCGGCDQCRSGNEIFCANLGFCGNAHAEYVAAPAHQCLKLPPDIGWDTGVLIGGDAMGVAYHLSRRVRPCAHDTVAVFGLGPIGLGIVRLWSVLGATVIGVDPSEWRREFALTIGARQAVAPEPDVVARLRSLTSGHGPDICVEATGRPEPVTKAFEACRPGGKVGIVGEQPEACFNPSRDLIHKELTIYGAWYFRLHEFPGMVEMVRRGLQPEAVITHRLPLERAAEGYRLMSEQRCGKVIFTQYEEP